MAVSQQAYSRIARKVQSPWPMPRAPWSPPALSDLVTRIDAALESRRSC